MAQEGTPKSIPDQFTIHTVRNPGDQLRQDIAKLPQALREEVDAALPLLDRPRVNRIIFALSAPGDLHGVMAVQKEPNDGELSLIIKGNLREKLNIRQFTGDAKGADWDGFFFRQADPNDPPFVNDNAMVKKGEIVGWAFIDKNNDGPIFAPLAGKIQFAIEDGATVHKRTTPDEQPDDATIIFYIDQNATT